MRISKDDIFRTVIATVLSLLAFIGLGIRSEQIDIGARLRIVEINQARIMERLGVNPIGPSLSGLRATSEKAAQ